MAVVKPQALTLADIDKIAKTEGAQAADAALQAMKLAREAREAEAPPTSRTWMACLVISNLAPTKPPK